MHPASSPRVGNEFACCFLTPESLFCRMLDDMPSFRAFESLTVHPENVLEAQVSADCQTYGQAQAKFCENWTCHCQGQDDLNSECRSAFEEQL